MWLDCGGFTACRPYAGIRAHAAGPVLLARDFGPPRPDPAHLCGRSFAKMRIGWSIGNRRSVFGRPPPLRCAANCRRCRQPARRPPVPPPDPSRSSRHSAVNRRPSRGSPKRIVRRGSGRRLGRLAFVAGERALQLPRLGEDPGGTPSVGRRMPPWHRRSRWGPRSTGASAPARFPGAARPGRHEPAEPILGTLGAGQRRAGSGGGTVIRGVPAAAGHLTTAGIHGVERHRRGDRRACRTRMGSEKGNTPLYRSAKSRVLNALRRSHGGPCGIRFFCVEVRGLLAEVDAIPRR